MDILNIFEHQIHLSTNRISMRPIRYKDKLKLSKIAINSELWQFYPFKVVDMNGLDTYINTLIKEFKEHKKYTFIIESKKDSQFVGVSSIYNLFKNEAEIGSTWIGIPFQKFHYNLESKFLLISLCLDFFNLQKVIFHTDSKNFKSISLYKKIKASFYYERNSKHLDEFGFNRKSIYYKIECDAWQQIRQEIFGSLVYNIDIISHGKPN